MPSGASDLGMHCLPMSLLRWPGCLAQSGASLTANQGVVGLSSGLVTFFR